MIKTNIKPNMHLERQILSEVHIFIGIYFEEEADGLMKDGAKLVTAIVAVVIVALVVLMKKRKAEN